MCLGMFLANLTAENSFENHQIFKKQGVHKRSAIQRSFSCRRAFVSWHVLGISQVCLSLCVLEKWWFHDTVSNEKMKRRRRERPAVQEVELVLSCLLIPCLFALLVSLFFVETRWDKRKNTRNKQIAQIFR